MPFLIFKFMRNCAKVFLFLLFYFYFFFDFFFLYKLNSNYLFLNCKQVAQIIACNVLHQIIVINVYWDLSIQMESASVNQTIILIVKNLFQRNLFMKKIVQQLFLHPITKIQVIQQKISLMETQTLIILILMVLAQDL